jgi:hypothetical protein
MQARILGRRASAMGLIRIHKFSHMECGSDVNFVRVQRQEWGHDHAEGLRCVQGSPVQY